MENKQIYIESFKKEQWQNADLNHQSWTEKKSSDNKLFACFYYEAKARDSYR